MRFTSLGSGSSGNALVVEVKQTRVMLIAVLVCGTQSEGWRTQAWSQMI